MAWQSSYQTGSPACAIGADCARDDSRKYFRATISLKNNNAEGCEAPEVIEYELLAYISNVGSHFYDAQKAS